MYTSIVVIVFTLIFLVLIIINESPSIHFKLMDNKEFLLNKYLKENNKSLDDRIVYLTELEIRTFLNQIYLFICQEKTTMVDRHRKICETNTLKHSTKEVKYFEEVILNSNTKDALEFINSKLKNKLIKIKI